MPLGNPLIDVACPECGEVYHLRTEAIGKRIQCQNKLCRRWFVAELPAAAEPEAAADLPPALDDSPPEFQLPLARTIEPPKISEEAAATPPVFGSNEAPPVRINRPTAAAAPSNPAAAPADDESIGAGAIGSDSPTGASASERKSSPGDRNKPKDGGPAKSYLRPRKQRRGLRHFEFGALGAIVVLAGLVGYLQWQAALKAPETRWQALQEDYQEHKWSRAKQALEEYRERFPDSPYTQDVPFFADMCDAGEGIFSQTGNADKGLEAMRRIFRTHRDSPAYRDYAADLYQAAARLVERFVARAGQAARRGDLARARRAEADLKGARQAHELLSTVAESMPDAWVPEQTKKLGATIDGAAAQVRRQLARLEILTLFEQIQQADAAVGFDELNLRVDRLLAAEPDLAKDAEIVRQRAAARAAEASHVKFIAHSPEAAEALAPAEPSHAGQRTVAVVWGPPDAAAGGPPPAGDTIVSLARGVLYAFDRRGALLWFYRVGLDSYRPPVRLEETGASPEMLIAASSEEGALVALDAATGKVLWRRRVDGDISAPLTVLRMADGQRGARRRGLLPTAGGEIHVLELALGKSLGRFRLGRPVTVGGAYDPRSKLAFFPADSERVFALDPAAIDDARRAACRSVLRTRHPSGAIRSEPIVVGQYFVLSESSGLQQTKLRVFEIGAAGFADSEAKPLGESAVPGWSWFPPHSTPDRITLATDQGVLGLFGLNLDNRNEAIYRLIETPGESGAWRLPANGASKSLAVRADDYLVWVVAGGVLRKLAIDWFEQTVRTVWPNDSVPPALAGNPVHQAQTISKADELLLFLTTMTDDGSRCHATAVNGDDGRRLWQRQLGVQAVGDPIPLADRTVVIDASGQSVEIPVPSPGAPPEAAALVEPAADFALPHDLSGGDLMRLRAADGAIYLAAALDGGKTIAVRALDSRDDWRKLALVERLQGRPAVAGEFLVVPCADGRIYRLRLDGRPSGLANEQTFRWSHETDPGPDQAEIYPLASDAILICDAKRRLRRLEFETKDFVSQWTPRGAAYESPHPLTGACLIAKDRIYVADAAGEVHSLDVRNPARHWQAWSLGGRLTGDLVAHEGCLFAVVDERRLACLAVGGEEQAGQPSWIAKEFGGRICGAPAAAGDVLLVTDGSRHISGLRREDGELLWRQELGPRAGPAAAAAPLGKEQMLVPLVDGSLLIVPMPAQANELAERSP